MQPDWGWTARSQEIHQPGYFNVLNISSFSRTLYPIIYFVWPYFTHCDSICICQLVGLAFKYLYIQVSKICFTFILSLRPRPPYQGSPPVASIYSRFVFNIAMGYKIRHVNSSLTIPFPYPVVLHHSSSNQTTFLCLTIGVFPTIPMLSQIFARKTNQTFQCIQYHGNPPPGSWPIYLRIEVDSATVREPWVITWMEHSFHQASKT